jgi:hypothetical protein
MKIIDLDEATRLVRQIARTGGVAIDRHCFFRMEERGVEIPDIRHLLVSGEVIHNPGDKTGRRFIVTGADIEGEPLRAAIVFLSRTSLLVITVMG